MHNNPSTEIILHWLDHPHDPFHSLGLQVAGGEVKIRVFSPNTMSIKIVDNGQSFSRVGNSDYFEWKGSQKNLSMHYALKAIYDDNSVHEYVDPYSFLPVIPDFDLHLFSEGKHWHIHQHLGANAKTIDGINGVLFATWAPNARRVSVVGEFNQWDGRRHLMRNRGGSGIWELFIPGISHGSMYKFEIVGANNALFVKNDPYAKQFELRPNSAAIVDIESKYDWQDQPWLSQRAQNAWLHSPLSIYEIHLGSWMRDHNFHFLNYRDLAHRLVDYLKPLGFTHIELLPITEHPLDASWGYQTLGYFSPTSRFGNSNDFRYFVDYCHQHDIGVILDWVPAHFPTDSQGLARFDGTALYEHEDPRKGEHRDWGTYIFNFGRSEVLNFLIASALYWLEEFHIDGLRVDAVASMLYLDYSREPGDWIPNQYGGNENLEAIEFLKQLNSITQEQHPGSLMIAEESTAWPAVSRPPWIGGLGFSMKWNMGWMHDILSYFSKNPIHRRYHHNNLTFGLLYAFTENFVLPFSHDEVVHGKGSMIRKMPGDEWQRFANLRLLYTFMFTYPGKKLLFMGSELAQYEEWNHDAVLNFDLLEFKLHRGIHDLVGDLNQLYKNNSELHYFDFEHKGFEWIDCTDADNSIISYQRNHDGKTCVIVLNFTPVPRLNYRLGVPRSGKYAEILNSDSEYYGGSNVGNGGEIYSDPIPWMGKDQSLLINLPPLAGIVFRYFT